MKITESPSVALIFGGRGYEHDVSVRGAEYLFPLIDGSKYRKIPVYVKKDGTWVIPAIRGIDVCPRALSDGAVPEEECSPAFGKPIGGLLTESAFLPIAAAFPLLHGDFGEDGVVQGALENAGIPYVGCDTVASAVTRDKSYVKLIAEHLGIPTARWLYARELSNKTIKEAEEKIGYPMFVKPARLGSSVGASVARCREELAGALDRALKVGSGRALIEELIDVERELECGYLSAAGKTLFTGVGEIYTDGFYDYEAKYFSGAARVSSRATVSDSEVGLIQSYSALLSEHLGLRGLSRIDFFRTARGDIIFNEINTMPGFTETSLYPRLCAESGISPKELVERLITDAVRI